MSSVQEPHLHLEVGHILFLDIVGYSKLLADEQKELVQQLNQIVRETEQFRAAEGSTGKSLLIVSSKSRAAFGVGISGRFSRANDLDIHRSDRKLHVSYDSLATTEKKIEQAVRPPEILSKPRPRIERLHIHTCQSRRMSSKLASKRRQESDGRTLVS